MNLSPELRKLQIEIEVIAREYGLDFPEIIYEVLDWNQLNEVAAYGGFPNRYPHWRFGMEYEQLSKSYAYGLSKIYEMVINTDPVYGYLLFGNKSVDQKLVMAHVCGHADFFKNNAFFSHTNKRMIDEMANHKTRVLRYIDQYGVDKVEKFIDACLSIETLLDYHAPAFQRQRSPENIEKEKDEVQRLPAKPYMEKYINPPALLKQQEKELQNVQAEGKIFPESPERDVVNFLAVHAPLENWERDILSIIQEEAYYFAPQGQTKILNEGWACFWHTQIMTKHLLNDSEVIDYADHHSGTVAMSAQKLNPYKIGLELFRDIQERWDKGRYGLEYEKCTNMTEKLNWDTKAGKGMEKVFEVRKLYNDVMFIDEFLTADFCKRYKLFIYSYNQGTDQYEVLNREFDKIKQQLLFQLTNFGRPLISVVNGNYKNEGELLLLHHYDGVGLKIDYAKETLKNVAEIWRRPVNLETVVEGSPKIFSFDGEDHKEFRP